MGYNTIFFSVLKNVKQSKIEFEKQEMHNLWLELVKAC